MNFYDVLAAKNWSGGNPTTNFFDLLFAQSMGGGEQWQTYEGTLPATINANGDDMRQYQIYGATGGVGDRTGNLFDISSVEKGRIDNGVVGYSSDTTDLSIAGNKITFTTNTPYRGICSGFIEILNGTESIFFVGSFMGVSGIGKKFVFYDEQKSWLNADATFSTSVSAATIAIPNGAKFVRISFTAQVAETARISDFMLTEGSTPPASYEPYGYKLDMGVSDGTTSTTTPIYIGDNPLDKNEYIDYQAGKIYRYETEIKKDVSQTGWQWRWETDDVIYQKAANNRVSVGHFYPEETKEYIISAVPDTFEVAVISADSSDIKTADTGWGASWTLSGASAHSFCVTVRKSDNSDITPSEVDGVKFKVASSLTPTDPPVTLPALPTCEGETVVDYAGQGVAPEKVYFEYKQKR